MWQQLHLCYGSVYACFAAYPCVVLQDERRDVDLLRLDAGEELRQVVQVADLVLQPRHTEGGEEPR